MKIWIKSQNGKNLIACDEISTLNTLEGANVYGNGILLGGYDTEERALEVLDIIQAFIVRGSIVDNLVGQKRVTKNKVFIMPKE